VTFISVTETAKMLGVTAPTLRNWIAKGDGPRAYRFGSSAKPTYRFSVDDVKEYIRQCATEDN